MFRFSNSKSILEPSRFIKRNPNFPTTILATWQKGIADCAVSQGAKPISTFTAGTVCPIYYLDGIAFCHIPSGGPNVAVFIEECSAHGAENFVFLGNCGALDKKVKNKLIIPSKALRDEGTSWHYTDSQEPFMDIPTWKTTAKAVSEFFKAEQCPIEVVSEPVWTTDCPYRETQENIEKATSRGCVCVDMECASIMAVSQFRNVNSYQILYPADTLYNKEWNEGFLKHMNTSIYNLYFQTAMNLTKRINSREIR